MMKLRGFRDFRQSDDGLVGMIAIIIMMVVFIFIIQTITANIIPLIIFLVLSIIIVFVLKSVLFGGKGLGIIPSAGGIARSAGKEGIGLIKSARSEYGHYKKKEGW
jgi:cobalamin biosynthesis protein CobD/CbiB